MNSIGRKCGFSTYSYQYDIVEGVLIGKVEVAWKSTHTGKFYNNILNVTLWMATMTHSLVHKKKLRYFGMVFQDNPSSLSPFNVCTEDANYILS